MLHSNWRYCSLITMIGLLLVVFLFTAIRPTPLLAWSFNLIDDPNANPNLGTHVEGINDAGVLVGLYKAKHFRTALVKSI